MELSINSELQLIQDDLELSDDSIKGNPAVSGGSLQNRPMWMTLQMCTSTSVFFVSVSSVEAAISVGWRREDRSKGKAYCHEDSNVWRNWCDGVGGRSYNCWSECVHASNASGRKGDKSVGTQCDVARVCQELFGLPTDMRPLRHTLCSIAGRWQERTIVVFDELSGLFDVLCRLLTDLCEGWTAFRNDVGMLCKVLRSVCEGVRSISK